MDLGGKQAFFYQEGQSLKLNTKAAVLKRANLLNRGGGQACPLGTGPGYIAVNNDKLLMFFVRPKTFSFCFSQIFSVKTSLN